MTDDKTEPTALSRAVTGALIPVDDLDRAVAFYQDTLGLTGEPTAGGYRLHAAAGSVLYFLQGTGDAGTARWPLASFETADIEAVLDDFARRGIALYRDIPFDLDERGISSTDGMRVAWFADPDGNLLTIFELTQTAGALTAPQHDLR
jgi:catechol 2,3-dioxygenase-like lactoylglutathione lyase family enzyme